MERTAPVTGNGASRPLRRGPSVWASAVKAITTAVAVTIRKGMSQEGARAAGPPGVPRGRSAITTARNATALRNAVGGDGVAARSATAATRYAHHPAAA